MALHATYVMCVRLRLQRETGRNGNDEESLSVFRGSFFFARKKPPTEARVSRGPEHNLISRNYAAVEGPSRTHAQKHNNRLLYWVRITISDSFFRECLLVFFALAHKRPYPLLECKTRSTRQHQRMPALACIMADFLSYIKIAAAVPCFP